MNIRIPSLPEFSRDTKLLISVSGIFAISFHGVQMLSRVLYVVRLGHGPEYVGLFNAAGAFTYMGMSLPSGALGSRFGARKIMLIGSFITLIGMASLPLAEFTPTWLQNSWPIVSQMTRTMVLSMLWLPWIQLKSDLH